MQEKRPGYPLPGVHKWALVLGFNNKKRFLYTHTNKRRKLNSGEWAKLHLHWPQVCWIRDQMGSLHNRYRVMHSIKTQFLTILIIVTLGRGEVENQT